MIDALREATQKFIENSPEPNANIHYWINMLQAQLDEARHHAYSGIELKALNEIADCIAVAYEALYRLGVDAEEFTERRIRTRIIPNIYKIHAAYGTDGKKHV